MRIHLHDYYLMVAVVCLRFIRLFDGGFQYPVRLPNNPFIWFRECANERERGIKETSCSLAN